MEIEKDEEIIDVGNEKKEEIGEGKKGREDV